MSYEKMKFFVDLNKNENNQHLVHRLNCEKLPGSRHREYLGKYTDPKEAVEHANKIEISPATACPHCCPDA